MKEYRKLTEAEFNEKLKKYNEIKSKIAKKGKIANFICLKVFGLWFLCAIVFFCTSPSDESEISFIIISLLIVALVFSVVAVKFSTTNLKKQKEYFEDIFKEERATFEGVITLINGQEVPGTFIQKGDNFFERKTETLYYKDKILALKKINN